MRRITIVLALLAVLLATGCESSGTSAGDCTSHYERVAHAATRSALKHKVLHHVAPRVHSLLVLDDARSPDKVVVNLLDRKRHLVGSLEMWQQDDGTWTAEQWSQCID